MVSFVKIDVRFPNMSSSDNVLLHIFTISIVHGMASMIIYSSNSYNGNLFHFFFSTESH